MSNIRNFRDLEVWKLGKRIAIQMYEATKIFPKEETFGIVSQIRKAGISIPSNIAEGFNRHHTKEFIQFLYISLGSCAELETQIEISHDLGYLGGSLKDELLGKLDHESRMLKSLLTKLKS